MAAASSWKINILENWGWNVTEWRSLGLVALAETALLVPVWEYLSLALVLTIIWLYRVLDFHFVDELLHGFRGEVPRLHHSLTSKLATDILPKCKILRQRYFATPWLASPHLQTTFLHFNGNPPPVQYRRQLFITPDNGTIALDWVKDPLGNDEGGVNTDAENMELDETPIVIIIPGLTSSSADAYVKHIAYESGKLGWRTLVSNHRGLGGVSVTDGLRTCGESLIMSMEDTPKAPIFTIGTSIGANILVKYLGEEGDSTPVGAAAAVCNPWDLLVGDRYISRKRVQKLYDKVLAIGLVRYASLHQTVLARISDWSSVSKSKTIRDFDHHCTRHVGKYETVDTYYRRCSSSDFLTKVAVPLLCFSALDDPVCTSEAVPWDEILANPNVVMVTTKHGGHLAYFESFSARTIWWARALTEFMVIIIPSDLMRSAQKVAEHIRNTESGADNGPYLHVSSSGLVTADTLEPSTTEVTGQENCSNEDDVVFEGYGRLAMSLPDQDISDLKELDDEDGCVERTSVTLTFNANTEISSLESALSQPLRQLRDSLSSAQLCNVDNDVSNHDEAEGSSECRTVRALRDCALQAVGASVGSAATSASQDCRDFATKSALSSMRDRWTSLKDSNLRICTQRDVADKSSVQAGGCSRQSLEVKPSNLPGYAWLASQNRRTFWLLTYVALVTTCPWIGSLFFIWWHYRASGTSILLTKR